MPSQVINARHSNREFPQSKKFSHLSFPSLTLLCSSLLNLPQNLLFSLEVTTMNDNSLTTRLTWVSLDQSFEYFLVTGRNTKDDLEVRRLSTQGPYYCLDGHR